MPTASTLSVLILLGLALPQTKPVGGAIDKYVPPVPTPASFISDQRSVLSAAAHQSLDARIAAIQRAGLGDVAVAIVPDISSYSPNQIAVEIYRVWRVGSVAAIGSAHKDVGALLLIVPKELAPNKKGQCWIATGTGAEGIITDATAGTICRDAIIPRLRTRDYAGAIGVGIDAIAARLRGDAGLAAPGSAAQIVAPRATRAIERSDTGIWIFLSGLGALLIGVIGVIGGRRWKRNRPRTCPRCGKRMRRLSESDDDAKLERGEVDEEKLGSVDYDVWVCECGQTLKVPYPKWFSRYSKCRSCGRKTASHVTVTTIPPTTISTGMAEKQYDCHSCGEKWHETVVLPRIVQTSSGGGSDGGSGGGGGGGGSSFGGSGSTSGGGGGGSY